MYSVQRTSQTFKRKKISLKLFNNYQNYCVPGVSQ